MAKILYLSMNNISKIQKVPDKFFGVLDFPKFEFTIPFDQIQLRTRIFAFLESVFYLTANARFLIRPVLFFFIFL